MAAAAVAAMRLHAPNAVVQQRRCGELAKYLNKYLTVGGAARKQEVVDAGGVAAVVAAMGLHTAEVKVQLNGCSALANLAYGDAVGKQATVDARGVAAVVAAMGLHTAEAKVQLNGCVALANLASPAPGSKQAVVDAGGVAAVLAAMRQHPADAEVQHSGCAALQNLTDGVTACKQAVVDAGGVAVLVAAMGQGGPLPTWGGPLPTAGLAARALANLAANTNPTVLEEVARTRTDCASWDGLREKLRECASAQLRAAEEGTAVAALEHAITLAAAVQVGAAALEHARGRVREINDDTKRQERRESLGLGSLVPPNEFSCPITMDKMRDPVVASDGHSYERSAILSVLHNGNGLSPLTREQLQTAVYPNRALKRRMLDHDEDMLAAIAAANAAAGPNNRCTPLQVPSSQRAPKRSLRAR